MATMVYGFLKLFITLGVLALAALWSTLGLALYLLPPVIVGVWLGGATTAGATLVIILMAGVGVLSIKWSHLSRVFEAFHMGNRVILGIAEKAIAEVDRERVSSLN